MSASTNPKLYFGFVKENHLTFVRFMTSVAARTGQIVNYANIASEVGVSEVTIKEWISIMERSGLVYILNFIVQNNVLTMFCFENIIITGRYVSI